MPDLCDRHPDCLFQGGCDCKRDAMLAEARTARSDPHGTNWSRDIWATRKHEENTMNERTIRDDRTEALAPKEPEKVEVTGELAARLTQAKDALWSEHGVEPRHYVVVVAAADFGQVGNHAHLGGVDITEVGGMNLDSGYRRYHACGYKGPGLEGPVVSTIHGQVG
jgi:hypothetical protein